MARPPPFFRTHSTPTFSSSSSEPASPTLPRATLHSTLLHALPLPHLLFDSSLRLYAINDAARSVFGVTSNYGNGGGISPSHAGQDFGPGGADVFFCVTGEMKDGKGARDKIRKELERLAKREEDRSLNGGGLGALDGAWGEGDRVELKSGKVPGLRWAAEGKVTMFHPPDDSVFGPASRRSSAQSQAEDEDDLPDWLNRRETVTQADPHRGAMFSVLLLRPWRDRPPPLHPAHEKLFSHRRSFSLDTPFMSSLLHSAPPHSPFSPAYSPAAPPPPVPSASSSSSTLDPPPSFASFTFPPHNNLSSPSSSTSPSPYLAPLTTSGPPSGSLLRRKESYSERTPTLGSVHAGNPFAWSSLAQRRESLGAFRRRDSLQDYNGGSTAGNTPQLGSGATGGGAGGWEFSQPFGQTVPEERDEEQEDEGPPKSLGRASSRDHLRRSSFAGDLQRRRGSVEEAGAPPDAEAWPIGARGPGPTPPSGSSTSSGSDEDSTSLTVDKTKTLRLPQGAFAAANAISPRSAAGAGTGSGGTSSSSGGGSARSGFSHTTATTGATSASPASRRGSLLAPALPVLPEGLKGMGISVSSAGIQLSQSSAVIPPGGGGAARAGGAGTPGGEDLATPTSSVLTPTMHNSMPAPVPSAFASPGGKGYPFTLHPPRPPHHPHPLSLSRSAASASSSSAGSSPSSQPPLLSPRPTALPPLPILPPNPKPDLPSLLKFAAMANLPNTGVILADNELASGYVNPLARELLMGVPASDGTSTGAGKDDWWNLGFWSAEEEPWSSMSASTQASSASQPFFSPSADQRANPFDAKDLTFSAIIASGEASSVGAGKGTAGSALRIGRAVESNRYRTTVAGILARSLISDERKKAALGRGGPPSAASASTPGWGAHGDQFKSPGGQSNASSSGGSASTTAGQPPSFVAAGGIAGHGNGRKPYKLFDPSFSQRVIDVLEPLLEMAARKGEEPPPAPNGDDSDDEDEALTSGAVYQSMVIGVETEVWEAVPSTSSPNHPPTSSSASTGSASLRADSFVTPAASSTASPLFTGRKKRVRRRIVEITSAPIFAPRLDGSKQHLGGLLLLRDVTDERKRSISAMGGGGKGKKGRKGDGKWRGILDNLPQLIWTTTPLGSHTYFNKAWYDYTGLEPEQSLGLGWQSPFHEEDMPSALQAWAQSLESGLPYSVEYRCRRYDGSWRWMLGRALPYRDADGVIQGWFGSCTDFDELYHMREQLRSTLQQNDAILAAAGCLLIAVDLSRRISFYEGSEKEAMLQAEGIELPIEGKPLSMVKLGEQFNASVEKVLTGEAPDGLVEGLERFGRTYRCLLTPLRQTRVDGSVHIVGCIIVASNITDLVHTQHELQQSYEERSSLQASEKAATEASRLKSEFLALTSHELRTPIAHILGLNELLLAEPLNEYQRNLASQILRSGDVLLEMIGQVLDMGKVEAGKLDLESRPFDLNELSTDARSFATAVRKKSLEWKEDVDEFGSRVIGDMPRLRQVLSNLLSNSIKFTRTGSVSLSVKKLAEDETSITVSWQVRDTGVGVKKEAQSQLFKPFQQADISTSRQFGGTGLGLSISKNLIEAMGGSIRLESEYGVGTTMTAELRLEKAPEELHVIVPTTPDPTQTQDLVRKDIWILIVDDNELLRTVLSRLLSKMGFSVDTASSGYEALEMVAKPEEKLYSLILMDHQMDGMDGLETTIRIRKSPDPLVAAIKIIALTASALKGDQEMFLANGADDYLSKPVRSAVLEATIVRTLQTPGSALSRRTSLTSPASENGEAQSPFGSFDPSSASGENDEFTETPRRRPSHPSYGEGSV
ncbi:hypothetical protein JCM8097_000412 [Rhodosporidiobolus ruineniae]